MALERRFMGVKSSIATMYMLLYTPSTPSHDTKHGILVLAYKTHPQVIAHFLFRLWSKDGVCGYYTASPTTITTPSTIPTMFMPSAQVGKRREGNNGTGLARSSIMVQQLVSNEGPRAEGCGSQRCLRKFESTSTMHPGCWRYCCGQSCLDPDGGKDCHWNCVGGTISCTRVDPVLEWLACSIHYWCR